MRVAHVLRKYNPAEWGGTESALQRLFDGLEPSGINNLVYCPRGPAASANDLLAETGCTIKRFRAYVPVWGISRQRRQQMIAVGGNLMSFDLVTALWREQNISLIHTHALGRLGGIALSVAKRRKLPCVLTIHGGVLDIPEQLKQSFEQRIGGQESQQVGSVRRGMYPAFNLIEAAEVAFIMEIFERTREERAEALLAEEGRLEVAFGEGGEAECGKRSQEDRVGARFADADTEIGLPLVKE